MHTRLMQVALAALVAATLSGCDNPDSRDLLAPDARPAGVVIVNREQTCNSAILRGTIFCQLNANADISAGVDVTCSLRFNGAAFCWGSNDNDILGNGSSLTVSSSTPVAVAGGHMFSSISVGFTHACAVERNTAAAFCWGWNDAGQLGDGMAEPLASTPVAVAGGHAFSSISAGHGVTCGVSAGVALCWGAGIGTTPTSRADLPGVYASISVGDESYWTGSSYCSLATDSTACEGGSGISLISQGGTADHFCEIASANITKCWGNNYYGQLGDNTSGYANNANWVKTSPVAVTGLHVFQSVATGGENTCALSSGAAFCWGWNYYQQLGTETAQVYASSPQAVLMPSGTTFTKIVVGDGHACAIDNAAYIWCWGRDNSGQAASFSDPGRPARVVQTTIY
jgi:alpha-tubulin suppressor-like RCC1 family protein